MPGFFIFILFLLLVAGLIVISSLYVVKQQSVAIIERFGRYEKISNSGIHMRAPFGIDKIAARVQLRLLQSEIIVETKTQDNVFVTMNVATQYRVNENNVTDAYYKLMRPEAQIKSYIEDALRSSVPKLTLDELFEKKDEIAYGYIIVKTLITKVEPDAEVKQSMNEINAAQRKRVAAQELAEADKIKIVTAAEAEAEKDRLHGVGIAEQRKAIVDGLADSIKELKGANVDLTEEQIMSILLTNQYLDTLNNFADKEGNNTIFLPANPDGVENIRTQILSALKAK